METSGKFAKKTDRLARFRLVVLLLALALAGGVYWVMRSERLNSALIDAALHGDTAGVHRLLESGADANVTFPLTTQPKSIIDTLLEAFQGKRTPRVRRTRSLLMQAAGTGNVEEVKDLLEHGADVRYALESGATALFFSASAKKPDCLELLIAHHADPRAVNVAGRTPLHVAAQDGRLECARVLLAHGADVSVRDKDDKTALQCAYAGQHPEVVLLLLESGAKFADLKQEKPHPLVWAAHQGDLTFLQALWQRYMTPEERKQEAPAALQSAIMADRLNTTQFFFAAGSTLRDLPLFSAPVLRPASRALAVYSASGSKPVTAGSATGKAGLAGSMTNPAFATVAAPTSIPGYFVISGRNSQMSPLNVSIEASDRAMFDLLLAHGADVNAPGLRGQTPLITAAQTASLHSSLYAGGTQSFPGMPAPRPDVAAKRTNLLQTPVQMAEILLSRGADIRSRDSNGTTALIAAGSSPEMIRCLLRHGADVNAQDAQGITPLMAASHGSVAAVRLLVAAGANINARDALGRTPLMVAALANKVDIVAFLLKQGADVNAKDKKGMTLLTQLTGVGRSNLTPGSIPASYYKAVQPLIKAAGGK